MLTNLAILTKMKQIFLYVTTNICYDSATPYTIHQRGHRIDKKKLEQGEIWSINPLLAVTQKTYFFLTYCFTSILGHAFSRIDYYVNALIERYIASCCRWIKGVDGLLRPKISTKLGDL